jgi:hypothetical protein
MNDWLSAIDVLTWLIQLPPFGEFKIKALAAIGVKL